MDNEEIPCTNCALKHIAKAEALLNEAKLGYPENFARCLANLSLAEDHVVQKYPAHAEDLRYWRKALEMNPTVDVPWESLLNVTALLEGYDITSIWPRRQE